MIIIKYSYHEREREIPSGTLLMIACQGVNLEHDFKSACDSLIQTGATGGSTNTTPAVGPAPPPRLPWGGVSRELLHETH